ncbi:hypothetical protein BVX98_07320 [bacterium F11]|nr:hypothetical protein BVX98_07320 [bacterium F11]
MISNQYYKPFSASLTWMILISFLFAFNNPNKSWATPDPEDVEALTEFLADRYSMDPDEIPKSLLDHRNKARKEMDKVREMVEETDLRYVSFEENEVVINEEAYEALDSIAEIAKKYPKLDILVAGHADSREGKKANLKLSEQRAKAVRSYLIHKGKLNPERIVSHGFGDTMLIGNSKTKTGRLMNRRVEFKFFVPKESN